MGHNRGNKACDECLYANQIGGGKYFRVIPPLIRFIESDLLKASPLQALTAH